MCLTLPRRTAIELTEDRGRLLPVILHYGFMQEVDMPAALEQIAGCGPAFRMMDTSYFLARQTLIASRRPGMALWREKLFAWMLRNAESGHGVLQAPNQPHHRTRQPGRDINILPEETFSALPDTDFHLQTIQLHDPWEQTGGPTGMTSRLVVHDNHLVTVRRSCWRVSLIQTFVLIGSIPARHSHETP